MVQPVHSPQDPAIVLVRARPPEDVADVQNPGDVVRIYGAQDTIELRHFPGVIRRVAQHGEGERPWWIGRRPLGTARKQDEDDEGRDESGASDLATTRKRMLRHPAPERSDGEGPRPT